MPYRPLFAAILACALFALATPAAAEERIVQVRSRAGVTVDISVLDPPGQPVAIAILFSGGEGHLRLWRAPLPRGRNFLIRSRTLFAEQGLQVVSIDAPSDRRDSSLHNARDSSDHRADIVAVVQWARGQSAAPVWLIGNSTGTISAAYGGTAVPVDGVVLTSSFTEPSGFNRATVLDAPLERIRAPTLVVHHRRDQCAHTPLYGAERIKSRLRAAPKAELLLFDGGDPPRDAPCEAFAAHGFLGIERQVVVAIADWIKAQKRP